LIDVLTLKFNATYLLPLTR